MSLIKILLAGTQQAGKSTLCGIWAGILATSLSRNIHPVVVKTHWRQRTIKIRDIPGEQVITMKSKNPHVIVLMTVTLSEQFGTTLLTLLVQNQAPILVILNKTDQVLEKLGPDDDVIQIIKNRREQARNDLSQLHPIIAKELVSGRIDVQCAILSLSYDFLKLLSPLVGRQPHLLDELYDSTKIRRWVEIKVS